jgi:phytoene dehydrogenase-like protein
MRHPKGLGSLGRYFTASHAELIDEMFTHPLVKAPLAALPCFVPISQDGTGWALMFFALHHRSGVARFVGGTGAITDALARCFAAAGGDVRLNAVVEQILLQGGRAGGVRLENGEEIHARAVITTNNVKTALTSLLPEGALPHRVAERARHIPTDSTHASSFKVDLALSGRLELSHHQENRKDGVDLRVPGLVYGTFEDHVNAWAACARGEVPDPLAGVGIIPTAADPTQAPDGQDTYWFWTGIAPARPVVPWEDQADAAAERAIAHAAQFIDGLTGLEIGRQVMTPPKFEERFRSPDGNVYHVDAVRTAATRRRARRLPDTDRRPLHQRRRDPSQRRYLRSARQAGGEGRAAQPPADVSPPLAAREVSGGEQVQQRPGQDAVARAAHDVDPADRRVQR